MSKTDSQLEAGVIVDENRSKRCGWVVVAGLVLEVILTAVFPVHEAAEANRYLWFIETWGPVFSDALVALGVYGEIFFAGRVRKSEDELRRRSNDRVAEAIDRAAKLEKEAADARERVADIERLTSWRRVSQEQLEKISSVLHGSMYDVHVLVEFQYSDAEAWSYSVGIATIFGKAGAASIRRTANSHIGTIVFGLRIRAATGVDGSRIADEFMEAGIVVHSVEKDVDLSTHPPRNEVAPTLYIFVGPKPPPELAEWEAAIMTTHMNKPPQSTNEAFQRATELERQAAPRRLSSEQKERIAVLLRERTPLTALQIEHGKRERNPGEAILIDLLVQCVDAAEPRAFASDICEAFKAAPVRQAARVISREGLGDLPHGLFVVGASEEIIRGIFAEVGIEVMRDERFEAVLRGQITGAGTRIFVSHKPL